MSANPDSDVLTIGASAIGCVKNTIKVALGHYVDLVSPKPEDIDIYSIASSLSKICRFGGHCDEHYSVAEHSVLATTLAMMEGLTGDVLVAILLHDAAEAYVGDMVRPLKITIPEFQVAENRVVDAIRYAVDVNFSHHEEVIKQYDNAMLKMEKRALWPDDIALWPGLDQIPDYPNIIRMWDHKTAKQRFIAMAKTLSIRGAHDY